MRHLDLFSGIGGFAYAAQQVFDDHNVVAFCDNNLFCQKILKKHWPDVPLISDIRDVTYERILAYTQRDRWDCKAQQELDGKKNQRKQGCGLNNSGKKSNRIYEYEKQQSRPTTIDLLTGGFPCQPYSVAGKQGGASDDRALFPELLRVIQEVRPTWIILENVPGIIKMGLNSMLSDLEASGYWNYRDKQGRKRIAPLLIPACGQDAPHQRFRVFVVAHSNSKRCENTLERQDTVRQPKCGNKQMERQRTKQDVADTNNSRSGVNLRTDGNGQAQNKGWKGQPQFKPCENGQDVAHTPGVLPQRRENRQEQREFRGEGGWLPEPNVGGSPYGFPAWIHRHIGRGLSYAESQRRAEILRKLWSEDVAKKVWKAIGGFNRIQKAEILFAFVRQHENSPNKTRLFLESEKAFEGFVRSLWIRQKITGASYRPKNRKQLQGKHPDSMQTLSRLLAYNGETNWKISDWEDGITRVCKNSTNRVDRLKSLGNAIVPQVAQEIMRCIKAASN